MSKRLSMYVHIYTRFVLLLLRGSTVDGTVWPLTRTSVMSGLAAVRPLTGSGQRVPQGADGRVLDPQRRAHQQQHRLPGALHPAPTSGSTSFTLTPPGRHRDTHDETFILIHTSAVSTHLYLQPNTEAQ